MSTHARAPGARFWPHACRSTSNMFILLCAAGWLNACATKAAYTGHTATELDVVQPRAARATVDAEIGTPERTEQQGDHLVAWYVYDRGFVGNLEEISVGEKLLWAPVMAWGEMVSLGLAGWMTACQGPCQKGWLIVQYDKQDSVIHAEESFLPDDHPLVKDCALSPVRGEASLCQAVREKVRPSSLPHAFQQGQP